MNRKFTWLVTPLLLACLRLAEAQQPPRIFRIGYIDPSSQATTARLLQVFRQEMTKLGWVEGKNIVIEYRFAELRSERMPELAQELIRWKTDVLVAAGSGPSAARSVTSTVPIVVATGVDLVAAGLAKSLSHPDGNVTGLSILGPELITKRLEVLREVVPNLRRVGVLTRAGVGAGTGQQQQMEEIRAAAGALKLGLVELPSRLEPAALDRAFQTLPRQK